MLSVCEVKVSLGDVNHLRLLHCQRADAAGNFDWHLVLHREHVHHHRLHTGRKRKEEVRGRGGLKVTFRLVTLSDQSRLTYVCDRLGGRWLSDSVKSKASSNCSSPECW